MLANTLPLPGGIGGVDGGMIGALAAFGVDPGLAVLSVLAYRVAAFWLPTAPGVVAYLQLRRTRRALGARGRRRQSPTASRGAAPRAPGRRGVVGAVMWWAFDVAALWACFRAFGVAPPVAVLVVGYFVGMLANTLPLPGGIGGVDGGMIGALAAFGVDPGSPCYRCSRAASPRSGCQRRRASSPTSSCAAPSSAGSARTAARRPLRAPVPELRRMPCPEPALAAA